MPRAFDASHDRAYISCLLLPPPHSDISEPALNAEKPETWGASAMRLGGIEPPTCGLKDRCSLAPRRLPLTTELQARALPRPF